MMPVALRKANGDDWGVGVESLNNQHLESLLRLSGHLGVILGRLLTRVSHRLAIKVALILHAILRPSFTNPALEISVPVVPC